ncbi:MAG: oligosaccharide flippase family protein [Candidatus Omnitrophota bacterium]|nr:MAG: oligosaccharide flippase family protein [Candidatus Omnitrophota bacterium]
MQHIIGRVLNNQNTFSFLSGSLHLILSRISLAASGVLFWWIAAKCYSVEDIGLGAVLISATSLLLFLSSLGITPAVIRFLPQDEDKGRLIGTLFGFSFILLIVFTAVFLGGIRFFLPKATILQTSYYPLIFFIFVLVMYIAGALDSLYIAFRTTHLVLLKNIVHYFLRVGILLIFVSLGGFGIFSSNCTAAIAAIVISFIPFVRRFPIARFKFAMDLALLKKLIPFSLANFLNLVSLTLPGMVFPLIILSLFSQREAGLFYIPWMVFYVYCTILLAILDIFLRETSYGAGVHTLGRKAFSLIVLLALAGILFFTLFGDKVLLLFKEDFSLHSFTILKILFSSLIFFVLNQIYLTLKNIEKNIAAFGMMSGVIILGIIIFAFVFVPQKGSEGVALSWLCANGVGTLFIGIISFFKRKAA